jgi:hypothetical protein
MSGSVDGSGIDEAGEMVTEPIPVTSNLPNDSKAVGNEAKAISRVPESHAIDGPEKELPLELSHVSPNPGLIHNSVIVDGLPVLIVKLVIDVPEVRIVGETNC